MGGGMILGTLLAAQSTLGKISAGKAEEKAYEMEAQQAEMIADQEETKRRRELNDALAMQSVMFAASGRAAGEGSAAQITGEDIRRSGQDIGMIQAGGRAQATGLRAAGQQAKMRGYTGAVTGAGESIMSMYKAGAFSGGKSGVVGSKASRRDAKRQANFQWK